MKENRPMTEEQRKFLGHLIENDVYSLARIQEEMEYYFDDYFTAETIRKERSAYLVKRLGSNYYSRKKMLAFQAFDRGETVEGAVEHAGCTWEVGLDYYRAWKLQGNKKLKKPEAGRTGIRIGSGAMFGADTRRDTIWLTT